jgi:mannose-6-phosphate isomerase-like protein (cupin superfamily)
MPALVKSKFGASGSSDDDGTMVCCFSRKKSRNDCRICAEVINPKLSATFRGMRELLQLHSEAAARPAPGKRAMPCFFRHLHLKTDPLTTLYEETTMRAIEGYFLITPDHLHWRPSNIMKIPNADFLERTKSENLSARLWRLPPNSASTLHKHIRAEEFYFVLEGMGRIRVGDATLTVPKYGGVLVGPDLFASGVQRHRHRRALAHCGCARGSRGAARRKDRHVALLPG